MNKYAIHSILITSLGLSTAALAQSGENIALSKLPVNDPNQTVLITLGKQAIFKFASQRALTTVEDDLYFQNGQELPLSVTPQKGVAYCKLDLEETPKPATTASDYRIGQGTRFKVSSLKESMSASGGQAVRLNLDSPAVENLVCVSANANEALTITDVSTITGDAVKIEYVSAAPTNAWVPSCPNNLTLPTMFATKVITTDSSVTSGIAPTGGMPAGGRRAQIIGGSSDAHLQVEVSPNGGSVSGSIQLSASFMEKITRDLESTSGTTIDPSTLCISDLTLDLHHYNFQILSGQIVISLKDHSTQYKIGF